MFAKTILALLAAALSVSAAPASRNTTYTNPILPGYRPDPSCIAVDEYFYCVSSTFNNFPGLPVYASKDLINWRHVSNAIHSKDQVPEYAEIEAQQQGIFAPTLRHHDGTFYIIVAFMGVSESPFNLIFSTDDPFDPESWGKPLRVKNEAIDSFDPDLFWDDDGQAYITVHVFDIIGNNIYPIDLGTGAYGPNTNLWNGTGGVWPEGPHIYKKDTHYYILLAEGGTGPNHMVTIARSSSLLGPYEPYAHNPILSNANTTQYFQAVGHADLFQDSAGNWWGTALAIRNGTGPAAEGAFPMGRETVLYPVSWPEGGWPQMDPVRGEMSGPLPPASRDVPGDGPWLGDGDEYTFGNGSLPLHFMHFRFPADDLYEIDEGLTLRPSRYNLTGDASFNASEREIAYVGRRQTDSLFTFAVDLAGSYVPEVEGEEAGVTLFLNQHQHADLGVVLLDGVMSVRFRGTAVGADNSTTETDGWEVVEELKEEWRGEGLRLAVKAVNQTCYEFSYGLAERGAELVGVGSAPATLVSGGEGGFVGE